MLYDPQSLAKVNDKIKSIFNTINNLYFSFTQNIKPISPIIEQINIDVSPVALRLV